MKRGSNKKRGNKKSLYYLLPNDYYKEQPFIDHLKELRRRLTYIALSVLLVSTLGYFIQQQIVTILLMPSHGQHFIYTSPGGGINFLFQLSLYVGLLISLPIIIYQILRFIEPVIRPTTNRMIVRYSLLSGILAFAGVSLGYFIGLPLALKFLSHQFLTKQIQPLFTIQEYLSFVTFYLAGSALIFQIPLIVSFIDHNKPLSPKKLLHYNKYVIVMAAIVSAIMAPTVNILSQLIIAGPIVLIYQLSILSIYYKQLRHSRRYSDKVKQLMVVDQENQLKRNSTTQQLAVAIKTPASKPLVKLINDSANRTTIKQNIKLKQGRLIDDFSFKPRRHNVNFG